MYMTVHKYIMYSYAIYIAVEIDTSWKLISGRTEHAQKKIKTITIIMIHNYNEKLIKMLQRRSILR